MQEQMYLGRPQPLLTALHRIPGEKSKIKMGFPEDAVTVDRHPLLLSLTVPIGAVPHGSSAGRSSPAHPASATGVFCVLGGPQRSSARGQPCAPGGRQGLPRSHVLTVPVRPGGTGVFSSIMCNFNQNNAFQTPM